MKTKIVPYNYDLEEENTSEQIVIGIERMSITYTQPADTNSMSDDIQTLTITSRMADSVSKEDAENKEGYYFDIEIPEGQHWSIEDGDELKSLVDDFKKRLYEIN